MGEAGGEDVLGTASVITTAAAETVERWEAGFSADHNIVFAYQLLKIKPKGWKKDKKLVPSEFHHRKAFLDDDQNEVRTEDDVDGEREAVNHEDLESLGPKVKLRQVREVWVAVTSPKNTTQVTP